MGSIIGWLIGKQIFGKVIGERGARLIAHAGLFLLIAAMLGGAVCAIRKDAVDDHVQKQESKQVKRERKADQNLNEQKRRDEAAKQQRQEEIDRATQGIPDQAPSPRQLARTCIEFMRQGLNPPECQSAR